MNRFAIILTDKLNNININSLVDTFKKTMGIDSEILLYEPSKEEYLKNYINKKATMLVDRVDPSLLEDKDQYVQFLSTVLKDKIIFFENKAAKRDM